MKFILVILLLLGPVSLEAKDLYKICIQSEVGHGCTKEVFEKKLALKIRDMFLTAPINAEYNVWVVDAKTGNKIEESVNQRPIPPNNPSSSEKTDKI